MWLVAFLAGFSDQFSDRILKSLVGQLGGDQNQDFFNPIDASSDTNPFSDIIQVFRTHPEPDKSGAETPEKNGQPASKDEMNETLDRGRSAGSGAQEKIGIGASQEAPPARTEQGPKEQAPAKLPAKTESKRKTPPKSSGKAASRNRGPKTVLKAQNESTLSDSDVGSSEAPDNPTPKGSPAAKPS